MFLKELSANIIIQEQLDRKHLPQDLRQYLNGLEFDRLLNKLKYEQTEGRDELGFPNNDIIRMLDEKCYVQNNIKGYDRSYIAKNKNVLFPKVRYVLYYLQQEPNYIDKYPQKIHVKRCDTFECKCYYCTGGYQQPIY